MTEEYKKSCEDELELIEIQQLHEATLQISKSCFEFKKLSVGLIGAAIAVLVKLSGNELNHSLFFIPLLICFGFWVADFTAYYYQRSTRSVMNSKLSSIAQRNNIDDFQRGNVTASWFKSAFNLSMSLYYVLGLLLIGGWVSYIYDWIKL